MAVLSVVVQRCNWLCHAYQRRAQPRVLPLLLRQPPASRRLFPEGCYRKRRGKIAFEMPIRSPLDELWISLGRRLPIPQQLEVWELRTDSIEEPLIRCHQRTVSFFGKSKIQGIINGTLMLKRQS